MDEQLQLHIYLIRHGEKSEDGHSLSKDGFIQVKSLAKRIKNLGISKIYSSDLNRCVLTSNLLKKWVKKPIVYAKSLREVEGIVKEQPAKHQKEIKKIAGFWNKITKKERGKILVVGSGNVNRILIAIAMGISPKISRFVQNPTGLTHLEFFNKNKVRIGFVNDMSHLPERLKRRQPY